MAEPIRYVYFWGHTPSKYSNYPERAVFSQWYPSKFIDPETGQEYLCAEQYMMAKKAELFRDERAQKEIMQSTQAGEMKKLGRGVQNYDEDTWQQHRYDIVLKGSLLKFNSDPELRTILLNTGDAILVEASPLDSIWGIGLAEDKARCTAPENWPGLNLLGKALTEARRLIRLQVGEAPA